jgi:hypothetical protein
VFEEATPMRVAWDMWGWGERSFDPNPHFFNYPSLLIYLNLAGQAILLGAMKLFGAVESTLDFRALYATDKTAFVYTGRLITACFGAATVAALYAVVHRVAGRWPAALAGFLLAVNALHVSMSQMIAVDVPLAFFAVATLGVALSIPESPTRRRHVAAGALAGLAASAKYTGALLVVPVMAAHLIARRGRAGTEPRWTDAALVIVSALVAFVLTSPFVALDLPAFLAHFSVERYHMQAGHFGLESGSSWGTYLRWLGGGALGWPTILLACGGLVHQALIRRWPWAVVLASFVVPYLLLVGSWAMRAERYLVPVVPVLIALAVAMLPVLIPSGWKPRARSALGALIAVVLTAPLVAALPSHVSRDQSDTRSQAREWIEKNIPAGSFIVTEAYGPHLYGPHMIWRLDDDVRRRVFQANSDRPYFAVQELPMYQVDPERSGVFYDHDVLAMADVVVITDAVRERYRRDPIRYSRQVAFYRNLENAYDLVKEWDGPNGIRIYRSRVHARPFVSRQPQAPPPLREGLETAPGGQERFYFQLGMNFEAFNHYRTAYQCYENAFRYSVSAPIMVADVALGMARCLDAMGRRETALELLSRVETLPDSGNDRRRIRRFRATLGGSVNP